MAPGPKGRERGERDFLYRQHAAAWSLWSAPTAGGQSQRLAGVSNAQRMACLLPHIPGARLFSCSLAVSIGYHPFPGKGWTEFVRYVNEL